MGNPSLVVVMTGCVRRRTAQKAKMYKSVEIFKKDVEVKGVSL